VRQALTDTATVIPPAGITLRTTRELRDHAAAHGITIPVPAPPPQATPPERTLTTPDTPENHLNLKRSPIGAVGPGAKGGLAPWAPAPTGQRRPA
ncbi:MAG: hypothetical protein ACRDOI_36150, partial [Trebonia sp.]